MQYVLGIYKSQRQFTDNPLLSYPGKRTTSFTSLTQECAGPSASVLLLLTVTSLRRRHPAANARQPSAPKPTNDSLGLPLEGRRGGLFVDKKVNTTKKEPGWTFLGGGGCLLWLWKAFSCQALKVKCEMTRWLRCPTLCLLLYRKLCVCECVW